MARISISIDEDLLGQINDQLEYGDSRSAWFETAARERLKAEGAGEDTDADDDGGEE